MAMSLRVFSTIVVLFILLSATMERKMITPEKETPMPESHQCATSEIAIEPKQATDSCDRKLSYAYSGFAVVYMIFVGSFWVNERITGNPGFLVMNRLLAGVLIVKVSSLLTFMCAHGLTAYDYISRTIDVAHLLLVIQLLVSAWIHIRPHMQDVDVVFSTISVGIQLISYIASITTTIDPLYTKTFKEFFSFLDFASCVILLTWNLGVYSVMRDHTNRLLCGYRRMFLMTMTYLFFVAVMKGVVDEKSDCTEKVTMKIVHESMCMGFYFVFLNTFREYAAARRAQRNVLINNGHAD